MFREPDQNNNYKPVLLVFFVGYPYEFFVEQLYFVPIYSIIILVREKRKY